MCSGVISCRKARRTSVVRIFEAQAASSEAASGRQTKMRRRLGVSLTPVTWKGPAIPTRPSVGGPASPQKQPRPPTCP